MLGGTELLKNTYRVQFLTNIILNVKSLLARRTLEAVTEGLPHHEKKKKFKINYCSLIMSTKNKKGQVAVLWEP